MIETDTFEGPLSLEASVGGVRIRASRIRSADFAGGATLVSDAQDALSLIYQMKVLPAHDLWLGGHHQRIDAVPHGTMQILDLGQPGRAHLQGVFDSINVLIPRAALTAIARGNDAKGPDSLWVGRDWSIMDPVVATFMERLAREPEFGNVEPLLRDQFFEKLITYLATRYGALRTSASLLPRTLASWQVRRAKEYLADDLERTVSLHELASHCGLSPSHFSRAFKASTGLSPYAWLGQIRVETAKRMLHGGSVPIAEVAIRCGFADQSQLTRAFTKLTGEPPRRWQRQFERQAGAAEPS